MGANTGTRIRQARTGAKLTQAALGEAIGLSAAEISKAERGELQLSQAKLKAIAKATGVTQTSLLNGDKEAKPAAKKKLVKLFRSATDEQKSDALRILNGEKTEVEQLVDSLLGDKRKRKLLKKI